MKKENQLKNKPRVLLAANDAGGANILAAWARKNRNKYIFIFCATGPAELIFKKSFPGKKTVKLNDYFKKLKKAGDFILTGTSVSSFLERQAIMLAKRNRIKCASFLDHWINYKERFLAFKKGGRMILPDEIWVGDKFALRIALKAGLPKNILRLKSNSYLEEAKDYFKARQSAKGGVKKKILFVSAPISVFQKAGTADKVNEFDQLRMLLSALKKKKIGSLTVRLHPSEPDNKFSEMLKKYKPGFKIIQSKSVDIKNDIIESDIVVGAESMGLVLAVMAKKKVISILPPGINKISLPYKEIIKVHSLKELINKI